MVPDILRGYEEGDHVADSRGRNSDHEAEEDAHHICFAPVGHTDHNNLLFLAVEESLQKWVLNYNKASSLEDRNGLQAVYRNYCHIDRIL